MLKPQKVQLTTAHSPPPVQHLHHDLPGVNICSRTSSGAPQAGMLPGGWLWM